MLQQTRICLGHYANKGLGAPVGTSRLGATHFFLVELTDGSKSRVSGKDTNCSDVHHLPCLSHPCSMHGCHLVHSPLVEGTT